MRHVARSGFALALAATALTAGAQPCWAARFCLPPQSQADVQEAWAAAARRVPEAGGVSLDTIRFNPHEVRITLTHAADRWTLVGTRPDPAEAVRHFDFAPGDDSTAPPPAVVLDLARAFDAEWKSGWVPCQGTAAGESGAGTPGASLPFWMVVMLYGACVGVLSGVVVTAIGRLREPPAP